MPIYEFVCPNCSHEFELIRSFSDNSMPACPQCANEEVNRQVGRPAIHFKGSGWYINDSKKASKSSANGKGGGGEDSKSGGDADKSDRTKSADSGESAKKETTESKSTEKSTAKEEA